MIDTSVIDLSLYAPAEAERGKFGIISQAYLSSFGYSISGRGRYAEFVYNLAPNIINLSGTTLDVDICAIDVNNWDKLILATVDSPLSCHIVYPISSWQFGNWNVSANVVNFNGLINQTAATPISTFITNVINVSSVNKVADSIVIYTSAFAGRSALTYTPVPSLKILEVQNDSVNNAYVLTSATGFDSLTANGLVVTTGGFYSLQRDIGVFTVASDFASYLRIIGHF